MTFNTSPGHPDEVVQAENEVPSQLIAEAKLRQENVDSEWATPQEKKQAAVERAHALSTRPDGSYAQLHETQEPSLAVADDSAVESLRREQDQARENLAGSAPVGSEQNARQEEQAAQQRDAAREQAGSEGRQQVAGQDQGEQTPQQQAAAQQDAQQGQQGGQGKTGRTGGAARSAK